MSLTEAFILIYCFRLIFSMCAAEKLIFIVFDNHAFFVPYFKICKHIMNTRYMRENFCG